MAARAKTRSGGDAFTPPFSHLQLLVEACEPALSTPCDTLEHKDTTNASNILDNCFGIQSVQEETFVSILEERGREIWAQHGCMRRHMLKPGGNTHTHLKLATCDGITRDGLENQVGTGPQTKSGDPFCVCLDCFLMTG